MIQEEIFNLLVEKGEIAICAKLPLELLNSLGSMMNMKIDFPVLDKVEEIEVIIERSVDGEYEFKVDLAYSPSGTRSIFYDTIEESKIHSIIKNVGEKYPWSLIF
jgi:hypothetical protein